MMTPDARPFALTLNAEALVPGRAGRPLAAPLDFSLAPGRALLVRGRNGAGKTSLLMTLCGQLAPHAGRYGFLGLDPEAAPFAHLHFVGHLGAVKPALSVAENLGFWAAMLGGEGPGIEAAMAGLGLAGLADLKAGMLSAGQNRRVALARLLVAPRPVWLLDEPLAALDMAGRALVESHLANHLGRGGIAVISTHDDLALPLDRVAEITLAPFAPLAPFAGVPGPEAS